MLELRGISKDYDGARVLGPLDLELPAGRTTVLIGPSGCGKSTLLRILLRLVRPTRGSVRFDGHVVDDADVVGMRRRMGYVVQDGGLFPHLSAADNVALMARQLDWPPARIEARVAELCDLTRFPEDALGRYPAQLSGGQRQRVSLMRALILDPEVLLLDEPLGALDVMIRAELQEELREIFRRLRKTVVLVTHDLGEAGFFADLICLLREGALVQRGTFRELVETPADAFVKRFVEAQRSTFEVLA
jgi:osmoprotectant transport system ATP-binding protein